MLGRKNGWLNLSAESMRIERISERAAWATRSLRYRCETCRKMR